MDDRKKHEIGYKLFKEYLVENFSFKDIRDLKRKVGNVSKEINISKDELLTFSKIVLREVVEEEFINLNKKETKVELKSS